MNWISLAFRNLTRNSRRSITTIAAVALGLSAVNIFGGFASYMFASIQDAQIYEQINGHIQIWKRDGRGYGGPDLQEFLLTNEEYLEIKAFAEEDPRVEMAARMFEVAGKIDYEGNSGNFMAQAMVPSEKDRIHDRSTALRSRDGTSYEGRPITDGDPNPIAVTPGMAKRMEMEIGADVILISQSLSGQMNAEDAQIYQVIDVVSQALDNLYIYMPLEMAQRLYDTDKMTSVRLLLREDDDTDEVLAALKKRFPDRDWDFLPWYDVSKLYGKTKQMFDIIFGLVFAIITIIVIMSVLNTIGMAVVERTREIGTLRAIGLKQPGVVRLFGIESALLGIMGTLTGVGITCLFSFVIDLLAPTWEPPVTARSVVWEIRIVPLYLVLTSTILVIFTALAAIAPAKRAARQRIVDSLGHV